MLKIKEIKDYKKWVMKMINEYEENNLDHSEELRRSMILLYEGQLYALKTVLEIKNKKLINEVYKK
tara:strand:+ start:644 stop:841 length:198 start_codon:yes stop_codon:yes gene_type:complete